tara:strand:- start:395 stop:604 length:210 start_codon:yes stop_codon:yes gene_type:complete
MRFDRRGFLKSCSALALVAGSTPAWSAEPESRPNGLSGPPPAAYPADAWQIIDDRFKALMLVNTPLVRH